MGWGDRRRRAGADPAEHNVEVAAAVGAAQLPAVGLILLIHASTGDDHGVGYGGMFGVACLLVLAPLVLPVLGLFHAAVHTMPAATLARLVVRRVGGAEWVWHLVCSAALALLGAGAAAALWDWPLTVTAGWLTALAVLPVLGVAYVRRRTRAGRVWGRWGVWFRSALASVALCVAIGVGAALASSVGLLQNYEPPVLSAQQLTGVWRGGDGAVLRLRPGGRADLTKVPAQPASQDDKGFADFVVCDGTGTWALDTEGRYGRDGVVGPERRDGVVVRLGGGCGEETYWTIGGTEHDPELFVLFGDPDAGDLHILKRDWEPPGRRLTGP
ncbi:hypothetical protein ACFYZJ_25870 [Streptomyces sp. NPDC001848]|uniref:hypothetical protein n=1 Tax=Streptomyces sp. NPDC001848 TaxID=3364618 RepID=UPI0036A136B9